MHTHAFSHYASESPHRLALVEPGGRHWSREELRQECDRVVRGPWKPVPGPGQKTASTMPNRAHSIALALVEAQHGDSVLAPFGIEPEQGNVHYCGLPLANRGPREWAVHSLNYGHTVILAEQWNPHDMLRDIARYRVTHSYMVPAQFMQLLALPPELRTAYDTSSIRHVICPVVPCPLQLRQAMVKWWDVLLHECDESDGVGYPGAVAAPRNPGGYN